MKHYFFQLCFLLIIIASSFATMTVHYDLSTGWNMIAVPCSTEYTEINDFLPIIGAFTYNSSTSSYTSISTPPYYGVGFWVLIDRDTVITITCSCYDDCECIDNSGLSDSMFCMKEDSSCESCGVITHIPTSCYEIYAPVCGCDDITYDNDCYAHASRTNVDHIGPCCECLNNDGLPLGEYCNKTDSDCDGCGEVATRPTACPDVWDPVCGCDDVTYGNDCEAAAAGQNVQHRGECRH